MQIKKTNTLILPSLGIFSFSDHKMIVCKPQKFLCGKQNKQLAQTTVSNSKSLKSPDLTAAQFEVQQIILNMTTCLNTVSSCHHCVLRYLCYAVASSVLNKMASAFLNSVHMGFHCMCKYYSPTRLQNFHLKLLFLIFVSVFIFIISFKWFPSISGSTFSSDLPLL